jgi:hypothetical protein
MLVHRWILIFGTRDDVSTMCAGDIASVEDLLAQGEDVNCRGAQNRTPLHRAVGKGHNAVVSMLIKQGADLTMLDQGGLTPLYVARHRPTDMRRSRYTLHYCDHIKDRCAYDCIDETPLYVMSPC